LQALLPVWAIAHAGFKYIAIVEQIDLYIATGVGYFDALLYFFSKKNKGFYGFAGNFS